MKTSDFLLDSFTDGWRRTLVWALALGSIALLGAIRLLTNAEFAFASMALLPVLAIAWFAGFRSGLILAFLAAMVVTIGDVAAGRQFTSFWIPWSNTAVNWINYSLVALVGAHLRFLLEREHEKTIRDPLTGLHNRRAFLELGAIEVERSKRYRHQFAVVFLTLDNLGKLNVAKGELVGDAALMATAAALRGALRASDRVARIGEDEFAVLLTESGYEASIRASEKAYLALNEALERYPPVRASIGVAWFGKADRPFPDMLIAADQLMVEVKQGGKHNMRMKRFSEVQ